MPFNLEVEFSGLCLFVVHTNEDQVAVLMPDARQRPGSGILRHRDKEPADPHVAYVRFNLANLAEASDFNPPLPEGADTSHREPPEYELIHRFDRQVLDFGEALKPDKMALSELTVPDFRNFAPDLRPLPKLFESAPEDVLLARTILRGGELGPARRKGGFEVPGPVGGAGHEGQFATAVRWSRRVEQDKLTVRITDYNDQAQAAFTLRPSTPDGTVKVKVANLCEQNPLEWKELREREATEFDLDFKWLYQLFEPVGMTWDQLLDRRKDRLLPVPRRKQPELSAPSDCVPATTKMSF